MTSLLKKTSATLLGLALVAVASVGMVPTASAASNIEGGDVASWIVLSGLFSDGNGTDMGGNDIASWIVLSGLFGDNGSVSLDGENDIASWIVLSNLFGN